MKFSWTWLNQFIPLNYQNINHITEKLTLSGFEVDSIDYIKNTNDKLIDISITPNRSDVLSIIGLSRELGTIFNQTIRYPSIYNLLYKRAYSHKLNYNEDIKYINYTKINHVFHSLSPKWIQQYLISYNIRPLCVLSDITKYIKLKWNYDIYVAPLEQIFDQKQQIFTVDYTTCQEIHDNIIQKYNNTKVINNKLIIYSFISNQQNISISHDDFSHAYNEAINLIQTYAKATIGKFYTYDHHEDNKSKIVYITKNKINNILGPIIKTNQKYLSTITITKILRQLNFHTHYDTKYKQFQIKIPEYRIHDITRDIDIIEEISRIYGFNNFDDNLYKITHHQQGHLTIFTQHIYNIRQTLRSIGLHETLNSSFNDYDTQNNSDILLNNIAIYNPMSESQKILRINLINNLIQNYIYNYRQKNIQCEFFEIGKVFIDNISTHIKSPENLHIAGILTNNHFTRTSWGNKPIDMNWFHAKGLMEEFLYKINAIIEWKIYECNDDKYKIFAKNQTNLFNLSKTTILYSPQINKPIGLFGQINKRIFKNLEFDSYLSTKIYGFEINLNQLINSIQYKKHLKYLIKPYSLYPSIIRDISFKINQKQNIYHLIKSIKNININIIESIHIFNEYNHKSTNTRSIGLRIIYRSQDKTLQTQEIEETHVKIQQLLTYK